MSLYLDLTEFLGNPIRTGIQRIAGEICGRLPPGATIPVRLHSGRYLGLSPALTGAIGKHFTDHTKSTIAEIRRLGAVATASPIEVSQNDSVLVPEVFSDPERLKFFCSMPEWQRKRCRFIVYDLLPLTHPEYFHPETVQALHGYFHVLRRAECCGFISEYTRDLYYRRLKRTNFGHGAVLPLGCDSIGPRPKAPALDRPLTFTVAGTIEPRKNHALILDAFEPLLRQIHGLRLTFVGSLGWVEPEFAQRVHALANDKTSGFRFHSDPDDGAIRTHLEQSRASIYISAAEGYGLPPVESLWCGTPVIASSTIPSLKRLGTAGIHYVEPLNVANLRHAVLSFLDNTYANRKAEEAMQLHLPTWKSFTEEVLRWCSQDLQ
jgi:glycosyltransferase involved in cell wall biosynthesis